MSASKSLKNRRLYEFGIFRLDTGDGLFVNEELVNLAPKVLQTLTLLVENNGRVISKDEFFEKVWADTFVEDGALSFNISQLRKTLARFDKETNFVETIPKRGFRFVAEVREIPLEESESEILIERRRTQELFFEEMRHDEEKLVSVNNSPVERQPKRQRFNLKSVIFFSTLILAVLLLIGFVRQFQQNRDLRSFDSIRSVKLTSWTSLGSSGYSNYSSSHDGKLIAYSSLRDGISETIFIRQFDGGKEIRLTLDGWKNFNPIWSPDDKQIAFVSERVSEGKLQAGIYLCPLLGGAPRALKIIGQGNLIPHHWSKDGSTIFYEFNGNLFRLDVASRESSPVTDLPASKTEFRYFAVSPDEAQIVFCGKTEGQTDIWLMPIGGEARRLTNDREEEIRPLWHPDGTRIFYTVRRDNHYQINLAYADGSEPVQVKRGDSEYKTLGISADGTKIFYATWHDESDIWGVKTETGEEFAVASEPESEFWADISPDEKSLVLQINSSPYPPAEIKKSLIAVRAIGEKRNQNSFPGGFSPKWLPDSRRIAFLRLREPEQNYNLWLFDTVSGDEKQLTNDGVYQSGHALLPYNRTQTTDYCWSPDSKKFAYLDPEKNNVWLASTDTGEAANLTGNGNPNINFYSPMWSPDGNRIAFVSELKPSAAGEKVIWSVWLAEQGNSRKIFSGPASLRFLGWSPDGNKLFFGMTEGAMKASPTDIKLLQVSTDGKDEITNLFEKISPFSLTLSPDAKSVAFSARRDGQDNIYISPVINGETKKITNNSNPDFCLGSLKWSPDGKAVYFDRQKQIYTISMFDNFN